MRPIAIIGCGPAGLMAAEVLSARGHPVHCFDAMPSAGRKFLMAGKSGLNLTHAEPLPDFIKRYGSATPRLQAALEALPPEALRTWAAELGISTFVGSSSRVFPEGMKAAPLLRAWLHRLRQQGVRFHMRHRWTGWNSWQKQDLCFDTPSGPVSFAPAATLLALGGASWPRLGSDGRWAPLLAERGIALAPFRPANCGFVVDWSEHFRERFAGEPVKSVCASAPGFAPRQGEFVISTTGVEGSLIYALSAPLRDALEQHGQATITLDLAPGKSLERLQTELSRPRGRDSLANHLRRQCGLTGVKAALLRECLPPEALQNPAQLAAAIKDLPLPVAATAPMEEAISTAGGIALPELDEDFMVRRQPGLFCAGEMLDWEAPTGGYLLTACLATGHQAGLGMARWLERPKS